jgi:hypothetical protein
MSYRLDPAAVDEPMVVAALRRLVGAPLGAPVGAPLGAPVHTPVAAATPVPLEP